MKRLLVGTILAAWVFVATACSAPTWKSDADAAGQLIWKQTPGVCFYVSTFILLLPSLIFIVGFLKERKKWKRSDLVGAIVGMSMLQICGGFFLWVNIKRNFWTENIKLTPQRIERTYYHVRDPRPEGAAIMPEGPAVTELIEWKDVVKCDYLNEEYDVDHWGSSTGGKWTEGKIRREIVLVDKDQHKLEFVIEKRPFTGHPIGILVGEVFHCIWTLDDNCRVSSEDEMRLKSTIDKYLPEGLSRACTR